jgi:uncharacterized protein YutE (UPF0331/DUF86 family)
MVDRDIITAKIANIQKNINRLKEKQGLNESDFLKDRDVQDIVLLNLQAAIQGCIDIASHIVSDEGWDIPGSMAGLFDVLSQKGAISENTKGIMRPMIGFRNLIVHEYAALDMSMVYKAFHDKLEDFSIFLKEITIFTGL